MNPAMITGPVNTEQSPYTRLVALPLGAVNLHAGFWTGIQKTNHEVSLHHGYQMLQRSGNFHNFQLAAGLKHGEYQGRNFIDSDVYKWLEAVAWELGKNPDEQLSKCADEAIGLIQAAQCEDGYINTYVQVVKSPDRWVDMDHGHELYCAGHLFQAAIAFFRAVGDRRLLEISIRFADLICTTFGPGKREENCGHPEVEMALIELYRTTSKKCYLDTAQCFINRRGKRRMVGFASYGSEYHQDHVTVREAVTATGHAVRQLYLNAGVTDLYLETGEQVLWDSLQKIWLDIAETKLYITGGVGSRFDGEAFGDSYELPTDQCYCETCATIANIQWNWRMLLASGESRYADMIERSLYNTVLSSPALDGRHFFYVNPLMVRSGRYTRLSLNPPDGERVNGRPEWHGVACCPPNVMRTFASLEHYLATQSSDGLQIHQYAPMELEAKTPGGQRISLSIETNYPREGKVRLQVKEVDGYKGTISLRSPDWCPSTTILINGETCKVLVSEKGYFLLERNWATGDTIEMLMTLEPLMVQANPRVDATRNCVAIQFGPQVYCLESFDQQVPERMLDVQIDTRKPIQQKWRSDLLGGIMTLEAYGFVTAMEPWLGALYQPTNQVPILNRQAVKLVAIPYYAWGNRGIGSMRVWIPKSE